MPIEPFIHAGACPLSRKSKKSCSGMKACALLVMGMLCVSCAGKSSSERLREVEFTAQENQNNIAEVTHRVSALENRLDNLSGEVRQINTRTYEVRNKAGRKTGMTAHPVIPPTPAAAVTPAATVAPAGVPVTPGVAPVPQAVSTMESAATQQKAKVPLPSMNDVPPPMSLPGQSQATRGNSSPILSLPPQSASAPIPQPPLPGSSATAAAPQGAPASVAVAPVPATTQRRQPAQQATQPAPRAQAVASARQAPASQAQNIQTQTTQAAQDSLALPPETAGTTVTVGAPQTMASAAPAATVALTKQGVPTAKLPSAAKGEEVAYKAALSLVMSGRAGEGRQKFNEFLQSYPSGRYAANAHYWIGESYYAQGNYPEALMSFKQVSTQFPRHHKTADALLKAGMTYQKLGDKENAQLQYKALQADFPNSEAASRVRRSGR